jgi:hypothetical protein
VIDVAEQQFPGARAVLIEENHPQHPSPQAWMAPSSPGTRPPSRSGYDRCCSRRVSRRWRGIDRAGQVRSFEGAVDAAGLCAMLGVEELSEHPLWIGRRRSGERNRFDPVPRFISAGTPGHGASA